MKLLLLIAFALKCNGFLVDSSTATPPSGTSIDDKRYNTLMDLLIEERQSRKNLEEAVSRELLTLKQDVTNCNCKIVDGQTPTVNSEVSTTRELRKLKSELSELKYVYTTLQTQFNNLLENHTILTFRVKHLEDNLSMIQHQNATNTKQLAVAVNIINNNLTKITNEANARKQDFLALYQKVTATENQIKNDTKSLIVHLNETLTTFRQDCVNASTYTEQQLSGKIRHIEARQNDTILKLEGQTVKLQQSLDKTSKQVVLTTCKEGNGAAIDNGIQFTKIKAVSGISNTASIRNAGVFTCERPGLYLISVFILSDAAGVFGVEKNINGTIIADAFIATPKDYATASVTVITHLTVNQTIRVIGPLHVYSTSCLSIVQIK